MPGLHSGHQLGQLGVCGAGRPCGLLLGQHSRPQPGRLSLADGVSQAVDPSP